MTLLTEYQGFLLLPGEILPKVYNLLLNSCLVVSM